MPFESSIQSSVLHYLKNLPRCIAENVSGNSAQSGRADINGCYRGRCFRIELKTPDNGNTPTEKQLLELYYWQRAGAVVMVAYSLADVRAVFTKTGLTKEYSKKYKGGLEAFVVTSRKDHRILDLLQEEE